MIIEFEQDRSLDVIPVGRAAIDLNTIGMKYAFADSPTVARYVGGSPANTAVGLARLGARVGFIGKVSRDSLGTFVLDFLRREGIDVSNVAVCEGDNPIGLAFTEQLNGSTNLIMYRSGAVADLQLQTTEVSADYIGSARCLVLSGTALAASPSRDASFVALEYARSRGVVIVFDIDYRVSTWKNLDETSVYYSLAAKYADVIIGSREEFDLMSRLTTGEEEDLDTARRWFGERAQLVVIKHGKDGSRAFTADGWSGQVDIVPVDAVKSTGGGDAYSSALIFGLLSGRGVKEALELATASASMVVGEPSCSEAMPSLPQLETFLAGGREKYGAFVTDVAPADPS